MVYLSPLFLVTISYLIGVMIQKLLRDDDGRLVKTCLVGTFFLFILWEADILLCDALHLDFYFTVKMFSALLFTLFVFSLVLCRKEIHDRLIMNEVIQWYPVIIIGIVVLIQIVVFIFISPDTKGNNIIETVNTCIETGTVYQYDPLTGAPLENELTFEEKLVSLPYFYAYICELFGAKSSIVVYRCMPMCIMFFSIMVYSLWADSFFVNDSRKIVKMAYFIAGVGLVFLCGSFAGDSLFYYQMQKGYTGETICFSVFVPFVMYECYVCIAEKKWQSIVYLFIVLMDSLFISDYQKGIVPLGISLVICCLIAIGYRIRRYVKCR